MYVRAVSGIISMCNIDHSEMSVSAFNGLSEYRIVTLMDLRIVHIRLYASHKIGQTWD